MTSYTAGRAALELAVRMVRPRSRFEWIAQAVATLTTALAIVAICLGLGVLGEIEHHNSAVSARMPVGSQGGIGSMACPIWQNTQYGSLEVIRLGSNTLRSAPPPGAAWPDAGTAWISPRLSVLLSGGDPLLKTMVPGVVVGTIGREALIGPDDLLAYVGVDDATVATSPCFPAAGFGEENSAWDADPMQARVVTVISCAVIGAGAIVALLAAAQLIGSIRERRLAACILIGMRPRTFAWVGAWISLIWASIGAVVGIGALWPVGWLLSLHQTFGVSHWATVALVPWPMRLGVTAGIVLLTTVLGASHTMSNPWAIRRRTGDQANVSRWRLLPLLFSAGLVLYTLATSLQMGSQQSAAMSGTATYLLLASVALAVIGVATAQPLIVRSLRFLVAGASLPIRLGVARLTHNATATRWMALGLAVGILGLGMASGMTSAMAGRLQIKPSSTGVVVDLPPRIVWNQPEVFDDAVQRIFQSRSLLWVAATDQPLFDPSNPYQTPAQSRRVDSSQITATDEVQAAVNWTDASAIAAIAAAGWQSKEQFPSFIVLSQNLDETIRLVLQAVSLSLVIAIVLDALAVGTAMLSLQARRSDSDAALLAVGVSRGRLAAVRAWEAAMAVLPLAVVAMVLACLAAIGFQHVDDATLPIDGGMLIPIVITPLAVTCLMALVAAAATPKSDQAQVRRD